MPLLQPPLLRNPEQKWNNFVGIGLVAIVVSISSLIATVSWADPPNLEKATEAITSVVIKILLTAAAFAWTASSFSKRKGLGIVVFSIVGTLSIFAFSGYLLFVTIEAKKRKRADRVFGANASEGIDKLFKQTKQGSVGDGTFIATTGDKENDELASALNYFASEVMGIVVGMNSEMEALKAVSVFDDSVLASPETLEAEAQKRVQALQIVERYNQQLAGLPIKVETHISGMGLSVEIKQGAIEGIRNTFKTKLPDITHMLELIAKTEQAELDYLRFMAAWYGQYQLRDHKLNFTSDSNADQYNALVKAISDASNARQTFAEEQAKNTQHEREQISKIGK